MKHYQLDITLLDDLVFSQRSATQGNHESLDRIPGTALWGWAAAWLHRHHPQAALALAHEDGLHFTDARPLSPQGLPTFVMPLCWVYDKGDAEGHFVKETQSTAGKRLQAQKLRNLAHPDMTVDDFKQAKGLRGAYVSEAGECVTPDTQYRLRTAIHSETGTARAGQLFGYQSLQAGQRLRARMQVADAAPAAVVQALCRALEKHARLGRSRSGEYGRVQVSIKEVSAPGGAPASFGKRVVVWLLSDTLLRDAAGRPCLTPDPALLGLPGAQLVPPHSALRHRRYSAWNAHRNAYATECQVLQAGSVLVFERDQVFTPEALRHLQRGLGESGAQGLGEVWVNPPLLSDTQPVFPQKAIAPATTTAATVQAPHTPLMKFLQRTPDSAAVVDQKAWELARDWQMKVAQYLRAARRYQGTPAQQLLGPSPSQWGGLASALESCVEPRDYTSAVLEKVLGVVDNRTAPRSAQGSSGVHRSLKAIEGWNVGNGGAQVLAQWMDVWLDQHLAPHRQAGVAAADWRRAVRQAVHACQEIRRAELHLFEKLDAICRKESCES